MLKLLSILNNRSLSHDARMGLLSLLTALLLSPAAFAGPMDDLVDCTRYCSAHCEALARRIGQIASEVESNCSGGGGSRADIVKACGDAFISSSDEQRCIRAAHSAPSVEMCSRKFVMTSDELRCVEAGKPADVVEACEDEFVMTADELTCVDYTHSGREVRACVSQYVSARDELRCLGAP